MSCCMYICENDLQDTDNILLHLYFGSKDWRYWILEITQSNGTTDWWCSVVNFCNCLYTDEDTSHGTTSAPTSWTTTPTTTSLARSPESKIVCFCSDCQSNWLNSQPLTCFYPHRPVQSRSRGGHNPRGPGIRDRPRLPWLYRNSTEKRTRCKKETGFWYKRGLNIVG